MVGACCLCGCAWDDYGNRQRCRHCRLLLLVCDGCCEKKNDLSASHPLEKEEEEEEEEEKDLVCEQCRGEDLRGKESKRSRRRRRRKKGKAEGEEEEEL